MDTDEERNAETKMMDVSTAAAGARRIRGYLAAERPQGDTDLAPILWFLRDNAVVAIVHCPDVDRDQALMAARIGVGGYRADAVIVALDCHVSNAATKPGGGAWGPGEMQKACDQEQACELGILSDCLMVTEATRAGGMAMTLCRYREDKQTRTIEWDSTGTGTSELDVEGMTLGGYVADTLQETFDVPALAQVIRRDQKRAAESLTDGEAQGRADDLTSAMLAVRGYAVLVPSHSESASP